ncbi:MAG: LptF/LptG family permease [Alphaproteobacteria bacterium]
MFIHLTLASLAAVAITTLALCLPVITAAFFAHLPPRAMIGDLMVATLSGITPTAVYLALPLTTGIGITLRYSQFASDGYIAVLHSSRLSAFQVAMPALTVALGAVIAGYFLSNVVAPITVSQVHDTIHKITHSLDHRLLPTHRFIQLSDGRYAVYLGDPLGEGRYRDVIVREKNVEGGEKTLTAPIGIFDETGGKRIITLVGGFLQERENLGADLRLVGFQHLIQPLGLDGTADMPARGWQGVFELVGRDFTALAEGAMQDPMAQRAWWSEATKRFLLPLLAIGHTLLGLGLVLSSVGSSMRDRSRVYFYVALILVIHVTVLVVGESLVRQDPRMIVAAALAALAEIVIGASLLYRSDAPRRPRRRASRASYPDTMLATGKAVV